MAKSTTPRAPASADRTTRKVAALLGAHSPAERKVIIKSANAVLKFAAKLNGSAK